MRRAGRIVAEVLALVESEIKPGVSTGQLDGSRRRYIRGGAPPIVQGRTTARTRPPLCISLDDEVVHGIPGETGHPRGPGGLDRRGRDLPGLARRQRTNVRRRRPPPEVDELVDDDAGCDDGRHRCGGARRRSATSARRSRAIAAATATASFASTSATASARRCTRNRRSPTSALAAGCSSCPGLSSRSSRCSRSAVTRSRPPDGWTVVTATVPWQRTSSTRSRSPSTARKSWTTV